MSRRSRPPRTRKSRNPEAPPRDIAGVIPSTESAGEALGQGAAPSRLHEERGVEPNDEMSALDAGWD